VSFYNENPKGAVDPTPIVGMVGLINDADKRVTQDFKNESDTIALLGKTGADLSGSEYLYLVHEQKKGNPQIDLGLEKRLQEATLEAIDAGLINSAHDCSEGGLAVALTESCISNAGSPVGATIELDALKTGDRRTDEILFGESPSRIIVSVSEKSLSSLEKIAKKHNVPCSVLGKTGGDKLVIRDKDKSLIELPLTKLDSTWRKAIPSRLEK